MIVFIYFFINGLDVMLQVKDTEETRPEVSHEGQLLRMWYKPSTRFDTPKALIYLHFACPQVTLAASCDDLGMPMWCFL